MIILGNPEFALGMRLAGLRDSHIIRSMEDVARATEDLPGDEFIVVNHRILEMMPELTDKFRNLVTVPDNVMEFTTTEDLKDIIKSAVGVELQI